jgi:hypothetical protein
VTRFFLRFLFDSSSNSPRVAGFGASAGASSGAGGATAFLASLANPLVWIGLATLPAVAWLLYRTPFGLRARAVGEKPEAATTLGVSVDRVRWTGVALAGVCAGLGGALPRARPAPVHRRDDGGARLHRARPRDLRPLGPKRVALACVASPPPRRCRSSCRARQLPVAVRRDDPLRPHRSSPWPASSGAPLRRPALGKAD